MAGPAADADRLLRLLERADLQDHPRLQQLVQIAVHSPNPAVARYVTTLIEQAATHHYQYPFAPSPPVETACEESLDIGMIIGSSSPYTIDEAVLPRHLLVLGQSGAGKTTLFYRLMQQLSVPFWSFDLKQDYRHLCADPRFPALLVVPWQRLRWNPLRPPAGVTPRRWAQVLAEVYGHANALLSASKNYLVQAIIECYDAADVLDTPPLPPDATATDTDAQSVVFPTLHDLQTHIQETSTPRYSKTATYQETVSNRLDALLAVAGDLFDCHRGYPLEVLLHQSVVFEFDGLRTDFRNLLMELLFAWVFEYRLAQTERGDQLRHVFFLDEGKHVFSVYKERQDAAGLPFIDEVTAELREFGEALVVADQEASKLTDSLKANTETTVLMPLGDRKQFQQAVNAMTLSPRQQRIAQQLGTGQAIIQQGTETPRPVQLEYVAVDKSVTDTHLTQQYRARWRDLALSDTDTSSFAVGEDAETVQSTPVAPTVPAEPVESATVEEAGTALSDTAWSLLQHVVAHPFWPVTERYSDLEVSRYTGDKAKTELVEAGLVTPQSIQLGQARIQLLELTTQGRTYLEADGVRIERRGRGGIEHRFWQYTIKQTIESAGGVATRERDDADVAVEWEGRRIAVEVAMGNNLRELDHAEKHLTGGFEQVIIACRSRKVRTQLRARCVERELPTANVLFRLVRDFADPDSVEL